MNETPQRLKNKARARGWTVEHKTVKGVSFLVFTKETDTVTVRFNASGDVQSAKVDAKRVNHHVKSVTHRDDNLESTVHNWLEW